MISAGLSSSSACALLGALEKATTGARADTRPDEFAERAARMLSRLCGSLPRVLAFKDRHSGIWGEFNVLSLMFRCELNFSHVSGMF